MCLSKITVHPDLYVRGRQDALGGHRDHGGQLLHLLQQRQQQQQQQQRTANATASSSTSTLINGVDVGSNDEVKTYTDECEEEEESKVESNSSVIKDKTKSEDGGEESEERDIDGLQEEKSSLILDSVRLSAYLDYATQPCDVGHVTI